MNKEIIALKISDFTPWVTEQGNGQYNGVDTLVKGKVTEWINFFIGFSVIVAVIMIIVAGYTFITAAGDADKIEKGKKMITAAVIGMVIVFIAALLVKYVLGVVSATTENWWQW